LMQNQFNKRRIALTEEGNRHFRWEQWPVK
jgi:hypothetical protein